MSALTAELRELIESGPLTHLTTINADGSPQVSVIWIGLDGEEIVSGHMGSYLKVRNERDPRVVLSFTAPRDHVYARPDAELPAPKGEGYVIRYAVERVGGVGRPWASG